ncbi:Putative methyltransferase NSUN7 [Zootermopsis nevadensis]|uniref:Putative methyltransferase NSUN7 n=2 Tax=Zootermopsis nevadensis TaxID=136037 RepID=A0A067RSE6_ZOONE|nr:Putative methyltransferase NSUN7 [Zootermopsis nevadensis]
MKNYYRLLELQRAMGANRMATSWAGKARESSSSSQPEVKRPRCSSAALDSGLSLSSTLSVETAWTMSDIAKAGRLLASPELSNRFDDDEEMRHVYSLVYDVFRYKSVLNQTLVDTAFFDQCPQFEKQTKIVWLLLYDLYKRRFLPRDQHEELLRERMFEESGLLNADTKLWSVRVKLAAAISRLRIKNNALKLSQLLPPHLRDERVLALVEAPVTAWINTFKIDTDYVTRLLDEAGLKRLVHEQLRVDALSYTYHEMCPKVIKFHPTLRSNLAQSTIVRKQLIVLQDCAFCFGPAVMCRILQDLDLAGNIAQTQITSPRSVAYLANVLGDNEKIGTLIAFGAGNRLGLSHDNRRDEYEDYLRHLGVTNVDVRAEKFVDVSAGSALLQNVVAVLATPNNTYSGVTDPVDLACGRGGDLAMLEVLTDTEDGTLVRVTAVLEEQRQTLRLSMSRPQIQVVLYETHSVVPAENSEMVTRMVNEMNRTARDKHLEEREHVFSAFKKEASDACSGSGGETVAASGTSVVSFQNIDRADPCSPELPETDKSVPPCDIFELRALPTLCSDKDVCVNLEEQGCYLAYVRRKEIVRLNARYMIDIAESRGLFGGEGGGPKEHTKSQSGRQQQKKPELRRSTSGSPPSCRPKSRRLQLEIERIAAPTYASILRRATYPGSHQEATFCCQRHHHHFQHDGAHTVGISPKMAAQIRRQDARRWWVEAAKYIVKFGFRLAHGHSLSDEGFRPRLKLTRSGLRYRTLFPLSVTSIDFEDPLL